MQTLATGTARVSRGGCVVEVDAHTTGAGVGTPLLAEITAGVNGAALVALRPRGGVQRVGVRLYMGRTGPYSARTGGTRLDAYLVGGWRVSRSLGRPVQSASFQLGVVNGDTPLGSQIAYPAPVPGPADIDVTLAYRFSDEQVLELPLLQRALVANNERSDAGTGIVDSLELVDAGARNRLAKTAMRAPAGHGFTYRALLYRIAAAMLSEYDAAYNVDIQSHPLDFQFRKEVQLIPGGDAIALANEIGDLMGLSMQWDEWGRWTAVLTCPEVLRGPIMGVLDERDILRSVNGSIETVTIRPMPEAWTSVCLTGTIQHTRDSVGHKSLPLPSVSYGHFAPAALPWLHNADNSYSASGASEVAADRKRAESLTVLDIDGETVVAINTDAKGWTNLSAARYTIDVDLVMTPRGGVYVAEQTAGAQAFAWPSERYVDLSSSHSTKEFDTATDLLKQETLETYGYVHPRVAIQSRALQATPWTDTTNAPGLAGTMVLGNGEGVATARARWDLLERRVIKHDSSDDGYRTFRRSELWGWARAEGWQYHYGDGKDSTAAAETFQATETQEETWASVPGREDLHVYRRVTFGVGGQLVEAYQETRQGALGAQEKRTDLSPSRGDYKSDADWQLAVAASRVEVQPMHVVLADTESHRPAKEPQQQSYELAQAPWQLLNVAKRNFLRGRARVVSFSIPPNPLYREGQWWHLRYRVPGMDIDHDAQIIESGFEQRGVQGPIVQRIAMVVF